MSQKEKFALYLTPEMKARLERRYQEDGSRSLTGFIENAINFYLDYLSANNAGMLGVVSVKRNDIGNAHILKFLKRYSAVKRLSVVSSVLSSAVKYKNIYITLKACDFRRFFV